MEQDTEVDKALQDFKDEYSDLPGFKILGAKCTKTSEFDLLATHTDKESVSSQPQDEVKIGVVYRQNTREYALQASGLADSRHKLGKMYNGFTITGYDVPSFINEMLRGEMSAYQLLMSDVEYVSSPFMSVLEDIYTEELPDLKSLYSYYLSRAKVAYHRHLVDTISDRKWASYVVLEHTGEEYIVMDTGSGSREKISSDLVSDYGSDEDTELLYFGSGQRLVENLFCLKYLFYCQYLSVTSQNGNPSVPSHNFKTFLEEQAPEIEDPVYSPERTLAFLEKSRSGYHNEKLGNILHDYDECVIRPNEPFASMVRDMFPVSDDWDGISESVVAEQVRDYF